MKKIINQRYSNEQTKPNITIATDQYFDVKMAAAQQRKTVTAFITEAILEKTYQVLGPKATIPPLLQNDRG